MTIKWHSLILLLLAATAAASVDAADNELPIQVEADRLTVEEDSGISTYSGDVTVNQGPMNLRADKVEIFSTDDEITTIVATTDSGDRLARYEQLPEGERKRVEGEARRIVYHVREERLELLGRAMLSQDDATTVSGDAVNYDAGAGRVNATSGDEGRVRTIIRQNDSRQ